MASYPTHTYLNKYLHPNRYNYYSSYEKTMKGPLIPVDGTADVQEVQFANRKRDRYTPTFVKTIMGKIFDKNIRFC
ncbi:unnamed protein product [Adineta steineri]|uniref:Uncharacterized protein n=1 Tax=Adineta steineri TaxID=433720 RepID=A0A818TDT7_9BILA|nr:unnamed protein product [Adineta steineri]CAF3680509.1 unnamed protein product [Adineta steineri]